MAKCFGRSFGVEGFERIFAIKRVLPNRGRSRVHRYVHDEAKIAVQLSHANIGQVFEPATPMTLLYRDELAFGRDARALYDRIRSRGERQIFMCCHIVKEVCEALEYAHEAQ